MAPSGKSPLMNSLFFFEARSASAYVMSVNLRPTESQRCDVPSGSSGGRSSARSSSLNQSRCIFR